jgi:hypothetical protein
MSVFVGLKDNFVSSMSEQDVHYGAGFGLIIAAWIVSVFSAALSVFA